MSETRCAVIIPGPKGDAGVGTPGTNGVSSFTLTLASFAMPAVGASVVVSVVSGTWAVVGMTVFVQGAGYMEVMAVGATSLTLKNLYSLADGNADVGTVIVASSQVSPSGKPGVNSLVTSSTASFPSLAAFYAADVTAIADNGVIEITGYFAAGDSGGGMFRYDQTDVASSDDGGRILVNGSRRFKRVVAFNDPIRAEFFGAVPNVATLVQAALNTVAIRKCVAYYNRVDLLGSALYPDASAAPSPLIYYIDNDIRVTNGTQIRGSGKIRTTIKLVNLSQSNIDRVAAPGNYYSIIETNTAAGVLVGSVYGLPYGKSDNVVVENLTLDCNASGQGAVRVTLQGIDIHGCNFRCTNVKVTGVSSSSPGVTSSECFPIYARFHADTTDTSGHKIVNCEVTGVADGGTGGAGKEVTCIIATGNSSVLAKGIEVLGCYIHDMDRTSAQPSSLHGIAVGYCDGAIIANNVVSTFTGKAVYADSGTSKKMQICDNVFSDVIMGVHLFGSAAFTLAQDLLIHSNIVTLKSAAGVLDPLTPCVGFAFTLVNGSVGAVFSRITVRENQVYGVHYTQPITSTSVSGWPAAVTGDVVIGSPTILNVNVAAFVGTAYENPRYLFVENLAAGIPAGAYIVDYTATSITLSAPCTAPGAVGATLSFFQKWYPRGVQLQNNPSTIHYDGIFIQDNVFETPDVGVNTNYYFANVPYSLAGYIFANYSLDTTKFKWGFNRNKKGDTVAATVIYSSYIPAYRLYGGGVRNEAAYPEEWPTDTGMIWYNTATRARLSAKKLFDEIASGSIARNIQYYGLLGAADYDTLTYNEITVACGVTNGSAVVTVPDSAILGVNYVATYFAGVNPSSAEDIRSFITEINGPTTITLYDAITGATGTRNVVFRYRGALSGNRVGICNFTIGSNLVTCPSTALLDEGELLVSANFATNPYIQQIVDATSFRVNLNATGAAPEAPFVNPAPGGQGNGGLFNGVPGITTYAAQGSARVFENVPYSWQIEGDRIWQSGFAQTYISEAYLDDDQIVNGHYAIIFGSSDTEKYIYLPDPANFKGREFFLVLKKGQTTKARGINLRVGCRRICNTHTTITVDSLDTTGIYVGMLVTGSGVAANTTVATVGASSITLSAATSSSLTGTYLVFTAQQQLLAPGLEQQTPVTITDIGYVTTVLVSRPSSNVTLTGIRLRATTDGLSWMLQARSYESGSQQFVTEVTVSAATSSYSLSTDLLNRELDGIVQVAFDTTDTDKTVVLPNPALFKGRKFELVVYKSATASARRMLLNYTTGIIDPNTSLAVANYYISIASTAITAARVCVVSDGLNWFVDYLPTKALVEGSLLAGGNTMALTNAFSNVVFAAVTQQIVLPYAGTYLVTAMAGFADTASAAPKRIFLQVYNTTAGALIAKSLQSCLFADITPNTTTQTRADTLTSTFFLTVAAATTLTLMVKQDTTATAAIYEDYTYFGAALIHA